ncbi:hypothetical protein HOY82DRAFT_615157 [Tuber indicum]|nr:hypothetical protein HOY82DRAFT_615157 [Tuber indicum]
MNPQFAKKPEMKKHIWNIFVKFPESQRQLSGKIKALLPQTNLGLGLATIFTGSVVNVYAQYSDQVREKHLQSAQAMGDVPDLTTKEDIVECQGTTWAIESILKPECGYAYYSMIFGKHRTRKTTLVGQVGHPLDYDRAILVKVFKEFHGQARIFKVKDDCPPMYCPRQRQSFDPR